MKKIVLFILLFSALGFGQGVRYSTQVQDTTGKKVSSPVVRFCSEPATGLTCTPLAAGLFSDRALTQPLANPFTGDINGNVGFYVAPGRYHAQVSGNGIVSFDVPDIVLSDPSLPYAGFVSVVSSTAPANQFATGVSAVGVVLYAQPTFSNISGTLLLTGAVFPNQGTITTVLHGNAGGNLAFGSVAPGDTTGTTGTGTVFALSASPVFTSPTLGDASATSITATSGVPFTALSGSSSNMQINIGRAAPEANIAIPQANGFFFTNTDLAAGDLILRNLTAARKIYLGVGVSGAALAVTSAGLNFYTTTGTLPASITNDTAGGIVFVNNAGGSFQFGNGGTIFLNVLGGAIRWSGATSGTTVVQASAVAGSTTLTLPAANDTLVAKNTTDTLTNKTISSPIDGITCVSVCVPILVQHLTLSGQTGAIVTTTLFSTGNGTGGTPGTGVYRVTVDLFMTAVGTGGTFQPAIRWNNGATQTCSQSTVSTTALSGSELASGNGAVCTFTASASTNITYEVAANAVTGTPAYTLALRVEYLGT